MLFTTALVGSIALAGGFRTARAQGAPTLFVIGFAGPSNELSGAVVGVGPESTTFVLDGVEPAGATDVPFTLTLVEGPGGISETIDIPALSSFGGEVECGFVGGNAVCTETASQGAVVSAETTTVSFTADVVVSLTTGGASSSLASLTAPVAGLSAPATSGSLAGSLTGSLSGSSGSSGSSSPATLATLSNSATLSFPASIETITATSPAPSSSPSPTSSGSSPTSFASSCGWLPLLASIGVSFWQLI